MAVPGHIVIHIFDVIVLEFFERNIMLTIRKK